jgi:transcriptional regulator with XRE-family HTH domain
LFWRLGLLANLKATMAARRLKAYELAAELGISPSVLSEIVVGRREASPELRARIALLLQAEEAWLFQRVRPRVVQGREDAGGVHAPAPGIAR